MKDKLQFKNNIKITRIEKNLSQSELAKLVGVSRQTIFSIENGQFNRKSKSFVSVKVLASFIASKIVIKYPYKVIEIYITPQLSL